MSTHKKNAFTYFMYEHDASKQQKKETIALMEAAKESIITNRPMNHNDFEKKVREIFEPDGSNGMAECIVRTLNESGQFTEVYDYYAKNGMNLSDKL